MRTFITLLVVIAALAWGGYESWARDRAVAQVLLGFAALFTVVLIAAFFELF